MINNSAIPLGGFVFLLLIALQGFVTYTVLVQVEPVFSTSAMTVAAVDRLASVYSA